MKDSSIIRFLKWDSDFFGMKVGKIRLTRDGFEKAEFIDQQNTEQFDLIYGFCNASQNPKGFWESLGFYLADCSVTLSMRFDPVKYRNMSYDPCDDLSKEDINACYEISETIAPVSRFYNDPAIGKKLTKKMYRKWIDTALDGSFSDVLFVERTGDRIAGMHAVKTEKNVGACTLIGVRNVFTGNGIGRKLWNKAFAYWAHHAHKVNLVKVKLSVSNIHSLGFHMAMGFDRVEETNYIYHYSRRTIPPSCGNLAKHKSFVLRKI